MADDNTTTTTTNEEDPVPPYEPTDNGKKPITNACNAQFDEWDANIAEWKKGNRELAKKKLEEMKKCIQDWLKSKKTEIEGEKKDTEDSPIYAAFKKMEAAINAIKGDIPEMVNGIVETLKAMKAFLETMIDNIYSTILDTTEALTVISTRGPKTVASCAMPI